ncbi:hypothetical protein Q757_00020 [Oenococcus alcoholitolerans]|uniref:Type I restriction modification DNA specificity domain-containing protein n=1 Tax=Oenococcus alcoholitolerans TaxID=931074 RepID=A0ABR4XSX9_9LACO|nr:hypothetical protein Q757_00020 [Oenococcus alcoholitolerans]
MNAKQAKYPQLRFKDFTDPWEQRKVGELYKVTRGQVLATSKTTPEKVGKNQYPVYSSQTKNDGLMGYYSDYLFDTAITWTTDGANAGTVNFRPGKFYSTNVNGVLLSADGLANKAMAENLNRSAWKWVSHVGNPKLMNNVMSEISVMIPVNLSEQEKISKFLMMIDNTITLHQRKLAKLKELKQGYLQKMFPKNGSKFPQLRFAGFADAWKERKLESFTLLITKQTGFDYSATIKPALVNKSEGNVYPFIQNKNFSGFKINMNTDFYIPIEVANKFPRITLDQPSLLVTISGNIGNVGLYNSDEKAFVGGAVGICKLNNLIEGEFILYELESDFGQRQFKRSTKSSSHANITVEMIKNIDILIPKNELEQKKLAHFSNN